jgi:hypothetical protein
MTVAELADRLAAVEVEVQRLKAKVDSEPWWKTIWGSFKGDPLFLEAMRLGREYRESLRPSSRKKRRK